ncbi:MAG: hypothetical protein H7287_05735, partial [Thermoleophilia bacterium]|nr:hypothetical protein [Thermoleophilia bacterium]
RSRYVPITGRAAAGADGHAATGADRSMSGVIVGRLRDATLGRAAAAAPVEGAPTVVDVLVAAPKAAPAAGHVAHTRRVARSVAQPTALTGLPVAATTILGMRLVARVTQRSASGVTAPLGATPAARGSRLDAAPGRVSALELRAIAPMHDGIDARLARARAAAESRHERTTSAGRPLPAHGSSGSGAAGASGRAMTAGNAPVPGAPPALETPDARQLAGAWAWAGAAPSASAPAAHPRRIPTIAPHRRERWWSRPAPAALAGVALLVVALLALRRRRGAAGTEEDQVATRTGIEVPLLVLPQPIETCPPKSAARPAIAWSDPPSDDRARIPEHA